jgi:hypothetical protein
LMERVEDDASGFVCHASNVPDEYSCSQL